MKRKKIIAGNWKMHGTKEMAVHFFQDLQAAATFFSTINVYLFPSFIHLPLANDIVKDTNITLGAQNFYPGEAGPFTGEISLSMLKEYGCQSVLVGHSERRELFHESLTLVAKKFSDAALRGMKPILCLGESLDARKENRTEQVLREQLDSVIEKTGISAFQNAIIAYEPVWAIGSGLTANVSEVLAAHIFIRKELQMRDTTVAERIPIIYGGSVKANNTRELLANDEIDGVLVGGASLDIKSFLAICRESSVK